MLKYTAIGTLANCPEGLYELAEEAWNNDKKITAAIEAAAGFGIDALLLTSTAVGLTLISAMAICTVQAKFGR